jgi:hypothetical protein
MRLLFTRYRKLVLMLLAGILALYSSLHFRQGFTEASPVEAESRARGRVAPASVEEKSLALSLPERTSLNEAPKGNLFASTSWAAPTPPSPAPPEAAPPPSPEAPPLPYSFVGLLEDSAQPTAFLSNKEALLIVAAGQTIDGNYRIDKVSSKEIVLTYLPLNQKQIIQIKGGL